MHEALQNDLKPQLVLQTPHNYIISSQGVMQNSAHVCLSHHKHDVGTWYSVCTCAVDSMAWEPTALSSSPCAAHCSVTLVGHYLFLGLSFLLQSPSQF